MCDTCNWLNTLSRIEDLLDSTGLRSSDRSFLESVGSWIEDNSHVTERQRNAVDEIGDRV